MLPDNRFALATAARGIRRRLTGDRATRFTPAEWPRSRGPSPNPRRP